MKKIETLVEDLEEVIYGKGGWTKVISDTLGKNIADSALRRFSKPQEPRGYLSLSALGTPCQRKLWYKINKPKLAAPLKANLLLKFFYGDMIEELILAMVSASGHTITGSQDRLNVHGIRGHRDAVIDGVTIDVKSCSSYAFKKFNEGALRDEDPFGYVSQLSSYVYGAKDDPLVTDKERGAFLAVDKVNGDVCLDVYNFSNELSGKKKEIEDIKHMVAGDIPIERVKPVPQSKGSPNTKLAKACVFCDFKKTCWPDIRVFQYSYGPEYLVHVEKEPKVPEIKHVQAS